MQHKHTFFAGALVALAIILAAPSHAADALPEKPSVQPVRGKAGAFFPYGDTYSFESIEYYAGEEGIAQKIPLPKNITAYVVAETNFVATPYLSMPTQPEGPALPDDLGYGFEVQPLGLGGGLGRGDFVIFDLDQGKTLAQIHANLKLRKYCAPDLTTFNPHMCAYLNGVPASEHTNRKFAVVSPIRSAELTYLMTMLPTVQIGFDNLVVAEIKSNGAYIPVRLDAQTLARLLEANPAKSRKDNGINGLPYAEPVSQALAQGRKDKVEELRRLVYADSFTEWLKMILMFPDDPTLRQGFVEMMMKDGTAYSWGNNLVSGIATALRLEAAGWPGAKELRENMVRKCFTDFKVHNEGFTDADYHPDYSPNYFTMLDGLLAGVGISAPAPLQLKTGAQEQAKRRPAIQGVTPGWGALTAEIGDYAEKQLAALPVNTDVESPLAFLRGAQVAHELGATAENALSARASTLLSAQALAALKSYKPGEIRTALAALVAADITSIAGHADAQSELRSRAIEVATLQLQRAEDDLRSGRVHNPVLEKIPGALRAVYSEGADPETIPVFGGLGKKKDDDGNKDVHIRHGSGGSGGGTGSGSGNGSSDGGSGGDGAGTTAPGDGNGDGDGNGNGNGGGVADSANGDDRSMPCEDIKVDRKNLSNFADQTHWMKILEKLKAANFHMDCGDKDAPDKDEDTDNSEPPPYHHNRDKCDELRDLPDAEKSSAIENLIETTQGLLNEINDIAAMIEETLKSSLDSLQEYRDMAADYRQQAAAETDPAKLKTLNDNIKNLDNGIANLEKEYRDNAAAHRPRVAELKEQVEKLLKELKDINDHKEGDLDKAVCAAGEIGKQAQAISDEVHTPMPPLPGRDENGKEIPDPLHLLP